MPSLQSLAEGSLGLPLMPLELGAGPCTIFPTVGADKAAQSRCKLQVVWGKRVAVSSSGRSLLGRATHLKHQYRPFQLLLCSLCVMPCAALP